MLTLFAYWLKSALRLGMLDEAIVLLERCLELAPNFTIAQRTMRPRWRRQRFDEALDRTGQLQLEQPDNLLIRSSTHQSSRWQAASSRRTKNSKRLTYIPDNARILTSYGHSLRYGGRGEDAAAAYQRAIAASLMRARRIGVSQILKPLSSTMRNSMACASAMRPCKS